jgi:hypothetical protein
MSSGNWVVDNLNNALNTWNEKLGEIWTLITQSPTEFKGGAVWDVMVNIHNAVQAVGLGLLVLFFTVGLVKTFGSFVEMKRPEVVFKVFIRFVLAKAAITRTVAYIPFNKQQFCFINFAEQLLHSKQLREQFISHSKSSFE